jgi:small subunit ribosomal protein S21|tara:strand:- start:32 stop:283 length:252 start_codon:yes stop_codon:yes gene_type:complete
MAYKKNFKKKRPKDTAVGLSVNVFNNNIEGALKILKRKVKDSNLFLDLKKKQHYEKPSKIKREKRNLAIARAKYQILKDKNLK